MRGPASMWSVGRALLVPAIVLQGIQRDLGFQAILLFIQRADPSDALDHARLGDRLPGVDDPAPEFGGAGDLPGVHFQVAGQHRWGEMRTLPAVDFEAEIHLLVGAVVIQYRVDAPPVKTVAFEQPLLAGHGLLELGIGVRLAQIEPRGVLQLPGIRIGQAAHRRHTADEPTVLREEADDHTVLVGLGIHLDVGVPSGGKQPFDGGADGGHAERLVDFERQDFVQLGGVQRLLDRIELNGEHFLAVILLVLRQERAGLRNRQTDNHARKVGEQRSHQVHDTVSRFIATLLPSD